MLARKKINNIATVSDEVFVLLVLENIWNDMTEVSIHDYYQQKNRKNNNNEHSQGSKNNDLPTATINKDNNCVHTTVITGQLTSAWCGYHCYGGWSSERLNCFNQLVKQSYKIEKMICTSKHNTNMAKQEQ